MENLRVMSIHVKDLDKPNQSVGLSKMESFPDKTVILDKVKQTNSEPGLLSQDSAGLSSQCRMLFHLFPRCHASPAPRVSSITKLFNFKLTAVGKSIAEKSRYWKIL